MVILDPSHGHGLGGPRCLRSSETAGVGQCSSSFWRISHLVLRGRLVAGLFRDGPAALLSVAVGAGFASELPLAARPPDELAHHLRALARASFVYFTYLLDKLLFELLVQDWRHVTLIRPLEPLAWWNNLILF